MVCQVPAVEVGDIGGAVDAILVEQRDAAAGAHGHVDAVKRYASLLHAKPTYVEGAQFKNLSFILVIL